MKRMQESDSEGVDSDDYEEENVVPGQLKPPVLKKQKMANTDREFSVKEISKLKKMETLFHSSLFRMQVSELLKSVSVKQKLTSRIESVVRYLSKKLKNLPDGEEYKLNDKSWLDTKKIQVPLIEVPKNTKGVFQFTPPTDVRLIGGVGLGTVIKPHVEVDLALLIPGECVDVKDHLNQRFVRKKALYLAAIASHLSKWKRIQNVNYAYHMGNPLRPILIATVTDCSMILQQWGFLHEEDIFYYIVSQGKPPSILDDICEDSSPVHVKFHVIPKSYPFKLSKFHIAKNNVRPKWFFRDESKKSEDDDDKEDPSSLPATKYYNCSILQDLCTVANEDFLKEIFIGADKLRQGLMLLKIWLRQRELSQGHGMFSNFLMTAYVAYLSKTKKINKMMSSYQIFKMTLLSLSRSNWQTDPPSLCDKEPKKGLPSMDEQKEAFNCVFVDVTGSFNMAYTLSSSVFKRVIHECQTSLKLLEEPEMTVFNALFMTAVPFARKFDHIFHVRVDSDFVKKSFDKSTSMANSELDIGVCCRTLDIQQRILTVLDKALGKRALYIQAKPIPNTKWHTSCRAFEYDRRAYLTFGIVLDPIEACNILNKGPPADAAEALEFRAFWGEKSEMRRFKDGTIHEAVLWSTSSNQSNKRVICQSIVSHMLMKHCDISAINIVYRGKPLDSLLEIVPRSSKEIQKYGTGEEYSLAVLKAFESVNRVVRSVSDLPLSITSIQGVHPVFRHSEVFPPLPTSAHYGRPEAINGNHQIPTSPDHLPPLVPPLQVVCGLEGSGKWPNDKEALGCMKALLHVKLGQELEKKHNMCVSIHPTHIDLYKGGFVFRLILACSKEITVLRTVITDSGMVQFDDTNESVSLERATVSLPLHSHLIHSVQQEHLVFSATVRLCKRWLSSQMVLDHIREEVVELLAASVFINPHPYTTPASPSVGFIRFLNLLSTFDWKNEILMVNLNSEFSDQDYPEVQQSYKTNRCNLPPMCIATPQDKKGNVWTKEFPGQMILDRLVVMAGAHLNKLENQVMSVATDCDFKLIFRPILELFDITIKLKPRLSVTKHQAVDGGGGIYIHPLPGTQHKTVLPVVDFDVFRIFLRKIQELYGHVAHFFFDCHGGNAVGLVWKSEAMEKKDFKMTNFMMHRPVHNEEKVNLQIFKDSILSDIKTLGAGVVEEIVNNSL